MTATLELAPARLALPPYHEALNALRPNNHRESETGFAHVIPSPIVHELAAAMHDVGHRLGNFAVSSHVENGADDTVVYWTAFQAGLTNEELAALPQVEYQRPRKNKDTWEVPCDSRATGIGYFNEPFKPPLSWGSADRYRLALTARYREIGARVIDQTEGSIWLPNSVMEAKAPENGWLPHAFSPNVLAQQAAMDETESTIVELESGYFIADDSVFVEIDRRADGKSTVSSISLDCPHFVTYLISSSPDRRALWYDRGLDMIVHALATAAYRTEFTEDVTASHELFALTGTALDMLHVQQAEAETEAQLQAIQKQVLQLAGVQ